jgi:hypothetical protein
MVVLEKEWKMMGLEKEWKMGLWGFDDFEGVPYGGAYLVDFKEYFEEVDEVIYRGKKVIKVNSRKVRKKDFL